jgi:hypothetical protein
VSEIVHALSQKGRLGLVKNEKTSGAIERGFQLGKLGFSLAGSYLGYQAQNILLGEKEMPVRLSRFQQKAARQVRDKLGAMKAEGAGGRLID